MSRIINSWTSALNSPAFLRALNGWATVFWIVMIPISFAMNWLSSVVYVSALSLWALVSGHLSAWQAARVEVRQDQDADVQDVIDRIDQPDITLMGRTGTEAPQVSLHDHGLSLEFHHAGDVVTTDLSIEQADKLRDRLEAGITEAKELHAR